MGVLCCADLAQCHVCVALGAVAGLAGTIILERMLYLRCAVHSSSTEAFGSHSTAQMLTAVGIKGFLVQSLGVDSEHGCLLKATCTLGSMS